MSQAEGANSKGMAKAERQELAKLVRRREQVAKSTVALRAKELWADFERKLAARYHWDQEQVWKDAHEAVRRAVQEGDEKVAEHCRKLGIPEEFRPKLRMGWMDRGENGCNERRNELRKAAKASIDALEQRARVQIESRSLELQTRLVAGALESAAARAFLDAMPTPEALMPLLEVTEVEKRLPLRWTP